MRKVYIAGAISANKLEQGINNIRQGVIAGVELLKLGYAPYIPHLDYQLNLVQDDVIPVEIYYKYDLEWLSVCDCMLVLPNSENSKGVKAEIEFAQKNGIPIYYNLEDLKNSKKERKEFSYEDYIKVLSLAKQNSDAFEYCLKSSDKYIAELKEKLKPFEDEYFRGLTNEDIAELAKKSIRLTKENQDLMDRIENLENANNE